MPRPAPGRAILGGVLYMLGTARLLLECPLAHRAHQAVTAAPCASRGDTLAGGGRAVHGRHGLLALGAGRWYITIFLLYYFRCLRTERVDARVNVCSSLSGCGLVAKLNI